MVAIARRELGEAPLSELLALPTTLDVAPGVMACHGSPFSDTAHLLETIATDEVRASTSLEVEQKLGVHADGRWKLILCGHTHLQRQITLQSGTVIANPGSVGLPAYDDDNPHPYRVESGSPHARYAVIEDGGDGWKIKMRSVVYDWEGAALLAEAPGRADVAHALRTGPVKRR